MTRGIFVVSFVVGAVCLAGTPAPAFAHCDGLDGPVVKAAARALDSGRLADVLIWVRAEDEPEIRAVFEETRAVRVLSPQAKALADRHFFETVVRIHRTGEGAPYTGLQPAGRDLGPAIPAADRALDSGSIAPLTDLLVRAMNDRLRAQFEHARMARGFKAGDVTAGREYIKAYVEFIHYVERLYEATAASPHGHYGDREPSLRMDTGVRQPGGLPR
jgi:hypothetical protein